MMGAAGTDAIAATVAALRAGAVAGIVDAVGEPGAVVVRAAERRRTFRVRLPTQPNASPAPSGLYAAVITEWERQRLRPRPRLPRPARTSAPSAGPLCAPSYSSGAGARCWRPSRSRGRPRKRTHSPRSSANSASAPHGSRSRPGRTTWLVRIPLDGAGAPDLDGASIPDTAVRAAVGAALSPSASVARPPMPPERAKP